ncbi:hypothetical protein CLHOM_05400 [Clostridium homopropionicum DSM 5847]|uniref:Pilus assembly protein, PilO n=1 Tax=Clostridium homopropionicum DSM 5847 TaxID=1121318 RepID=A0A0L6ZDC2_9CLOT|nr:hypothetical protein [Clostridium homopropionicum]KOA20952.1 hypothetical protein CLHOM_05400 [Clostridium homopropionicum DSM 5847]SFG01336.1 hypothetical protein SAMN04488501_104180 [Clostridium homopropionicum]
MKNNRNNYIKLTLIVLFFTLSLILNYFEKSEIINREEKIEQECYSAVTIEREPKSFSDILESIVDKKYLKVKKISNSTMDNDLINVIIEFQGELLLLNNFMESIKLNNDIHSVDKIELKKNEDKTYTGILDINFYSVKK